MFEMKNQGTIVKTFLAGKYNFSHKKVKTNLQNEYYLQPSLASLGDGLPGRAGSQRDEAKMQAPVLLKT